MNIRHLDQIVALLLIGFGVYLIWAGRDYGFMQGTTPGAGYFPALMGGVMIVLSAVNLARSLMGVERLKASMTRVDVMKFLAIVAALLVFVLITPWLGMTLAAMALMLAIGLIIRPSTERVFLLRLGLTAVIVPIVCKLLFGSVLNVPIVEGLFGF